MEDKDIQVSLAQTALISSVITLLIISGVLFLAREQLTQYFIDEVSKVEKASEINPAKTSDSEPLVLMIAKVEPAVVSVVITKDVPVYERYFENLDPWGIFNVPRLRSSGTKEQEVGGGSGFVVSNDGMIVTNNHVVSDEEARYSVVLSDGTSYAVEVLARDADLDIAILKINEPLQNPLAVISFGDSSSLKLGQTVVAIGNALTEFQNSVSVGVVSGLSRSIVASDVATGQSERLDYVIQTDAAINPGNSGGPLLNLQGEVIGVNVAMSQGADSIGFALPAQIVKQAFDSVRQYGEIVRPYIGVRYTMVTPRLAQANKLNVSYGALVARGLQPEEVAVISGSPADKAGIVENDVILSIDGEELKDKDLASLLRTKTVGQEITIKLLSKGEEKTITMILEKAL
jgi:serine protease Do